MPHPLTHLPESIYWTYRRGLNQLYKRLRPVDKTNVFEKNWDVLIVLDACRPDLLAEVSEDFRWLPESIPTIYSVGSSSCEWMEATFGEASEHDLRQTTLVTGNVHSERCLNSTVIGSIYEVWKSHWDEEIGTVRPRPITDHGIHVARSESPERLILHYMQPHFPSLTAPRLGPGFAEEDGDWVWDGTSVWNQVRKGDLEFEDVWEAYRGNLRTVLDDVEILLSNVDAETIMITADHANAIGEWGFYDHPGGHHLPFLLEVPWVETTAEDERTYSPSIEPGTTESDNVSPEDKLRRLGYL